MCSHLAQIVYGSLLMVIMGLTASALFTNKWATTEAVEIENPGALWCNGEPNECKDYFNNLPQFQQTVLIAMILALVMEVVALAYNAFTFCACCCKKYLIHPLTGISVLVAACLGVAVFVYVSNSMEQFEQFKKIAESKGKDTSNLTIDAVSHGISMILAAIAFGLAIGNTVVAILAVFFAKHLI